MMSATELEKLFKFNAQDLEANRLGQLSRKQKQRLANNFQNQLIGGIVVGLIFIGVGFAIAYYAEGMFGSVIFAALGILLILVMLMVNTVSVNDLHVQRVSAYLSKKIEDRGEDTNYYLIMGAIRFSVEKRIFDSFEEGAGYHFYYYQRQVNKWFKEAPQIIAAEPTTNISEPEFHKKKLL